MRLSRGRLADVLTVLFVLAAATLFVQRMVERPASPGDPAAAVAADERALMAARPVTIRATALADSAQSTIDFRSPGAKLVLLYRSDCPACRALRPRWEELASNVGGRARVLAISSRPDDAGIRYFDSPAVETFAAVAREELRVSFPSGFVPVTVVISDDGVITFARVGQLSPADVDTISRLLGPHPLGVVPARAAGSSTAR